MANPYRLSLKWLRTHKLFAWWCSAFLLDLLILGAVLWQELRAPLLHYGLLARASELPLLIIAAILYGLLARASVLPVLIIAAILSVGLYSRLPWQNRVSRIVQIEQFQSVLRESKFNGEILATSLRMTVEQMSSRAAAASALPEAPSSADSSTVEVKLGVAGISIPFFAVKKGWMWLRARQLIRVQTVIYDNSSPTKLVMWCGRKAYPVQLEDAPLGVEKALYELARELLRLLDPITLARYCSSECQYSQAIVIYKGEIANAPKRVPELELELAAVELRAFRADRALSTLQDLERRRISADLRSQLKALETAVRFDRGEYGQCTEVARKELQDRPSDERAIYFRWTLANVSVSEENYEDALLQWDEFKRVVAAPLASRLQSPLKDWSQLIDEVGVVTEKSEYFAPVHNLFLAWIQQEICVQRLGRDPRWCFDNAMQCVEALNLVDFSPGHARQMGARVVRVYADYCLQHEPGMESNVLDLGLKWEEDAIGRYRAEIEYRPGNIDVLRGFAWSCIGKFDFLNRMVRLATKERAELEEKRNQALSEAKKALRRLDGIADKFMQVEVAYGRAWLAAIQAMADQAAAFLQQAISNSRSETGFSAIMNRARLVEDFENIRAVGSFRALIYPNP